MKRLFIAWAVVFLAGLVGAHAVTHSPGYNYTFSITTGGTTLWADPPSGFTTTAGVDHYPSLTQPSLSGDIVGIRFENNTGSTEAAGYVTYGMVFLDDSTHAKVQTTDVLVARNTSTSTNNYVQMDVKATNTDGSVRHAILSHQIPSIGTSPKFIDMMLAKCTSSCPSAPSPAAPSAASINAGSWAANTTYDVNVSLDLSINPVGYIDLDVIGCIGSGCRIVKSDTGGSLSNQTLWVKPTCVNGAGETSTVNNSGSVFGELSFALSAGTSTQSVVFSPPQCGQSATGWNLYASNSSGTEKKQNGSLTGPTSNFTMTTLATATASAPSTNTATITTQTKSCKTLLGGTTTTWLSGSVVKEYVVSGTVANGDLTIECHVRAYADGTTRTDVVFNDAWLTHRAGGFVYANTSTVTQTPSGGTSYTFPAGARQYPYSQWHKEMYGNGLVTPNIQYDVPYLIATGTVPAYDTSIGFTTATITSYNASATGLPFNGGYDSVNALVDGLVTDMGRTGGRADIGTLTGYQSAWLMTQDATAYRVIMDHSDVAGAVPWHYRNEATNKPASRSDTGYSTFWPDTRDSASAALLGSGLPSICQACVAPDGDVWQTDGAHAPTLSYIPYMISGSYYRLQELQYQGAWVIYDKNSIFGDITWAYPNRFTDITPTLSGGPISYQLSIANQTRDASWGLRDIAYAAFLSPDGDALKTYLVNAISDNLNSLYSQYISPKQSDGAYGAIAGFVAGVNTVDIPLHAGNACPLIPGGAGHTYFNLVMGRLVKLAGYGLGTNSSTNATAVGQLAKQFYAGLFTNGANGMNPLVGAFYFTMTNWPSGGYAGGGVCENVTGAMSTWADYYTNNRTYYDATLGFGFPPPPANGNMAYFSDARYPYTAISALTENYNFTASKQTLQAFSYVMVHNIRDYANDSINRVSEIRTGNNFSTVIVLPDGSYLTNDRIVVDYTASSPVTITLTGRQAFGGVYGAVTATINGAANTSEIMYGSQGATTFNPGVGNDFLFSDPEATGLQTFNDNTGNNYMYGGQSASQNVFSFGGVSLNNSGQDTVVNFRPGTDIIKIKTNLDGSGVTTAAQVAALCATSGSDTLCTWGGGNTLTITANTGVAASWFQIF